jgi:ATP-dependent Clp protease ATP-binding subunit ClpC
VFDRFTERAKRAVVLAQDEALALDSDSVGTEHLLLGLLGVREGLAAVVLHGLDVTAEEVLAQVVPVVGRGEQAPQGEIPFNGEAAKALELALREALSIGHNYIGTEHILLGLVRDEKGVAAGILLDFDVDAETVRRDVVRRLSASRAGAGVAEPNESGGRPSAQSVAARRTRTAPIPLAVGLVFSGVAFGLGLFAGWLIWD